MGRGAPGVSTHSRIGASSMYRWSVCPGSVRLSAAVPNVSSTYAEEGTLAHDIAAGCLNMGTDAWQDPECDPGMAEAVQVYLDYVREQAGEADTLLVEHKFDLSSVYPGCFGTADAVIYKPAEKLLIVADYKHGAGKLVQVKGNPQLDYYALGALVTLPGLLVDTVRKVIVQPRCAHADGPVRTEDVSAIDLLEFRADLIEYARKTEDESAALVPGDHCGFCPAAATCPALHAQATGIARTEFSAARAYDPERLREALDARDAVRAWLKALDEFAYREAEAGRCPPGYKLVDKRATRKWSSEGQAAEVLTADGFAPDQIYEPRALRSPAQIEAVVGKKKFAVHEGLQALVSKASSGKALVPESDARAPAIASAAQDFSPVVQTT